MPGNAIRCPGLHCQRPSFPNLVHILTNLNQNWPLFRRCRCYSVEFYYGAVWGDKFLSRFPSNFVTASGRSDSLQTSTQWYNLTSNQSSFMRNVRMTNPRGVRPIMAHTGQRSERVGNSLVQVYERGWKSVNSGCKRLKSWLTDAYWAVKRTRKLPWLSDWLILKRQCNRRLVYKRVRGRNTGQGLPVRVVTLSSLPPGGGQYANKQTNKKQYSSLRAYIAKFT